MTKIEAYGIIESISRCMVNLVPVYHKLEADNSENNVKECVNELKELNDDLNSIKTQLYSLITIE